MTFNNIIGIVYRRMYAVIIGKFIPQQQLLRRINKAAQMLVQFAHQLSVLTARHRVFATKRIHFRKLYVDVFPTLRQRRNTVLRAKTDTVKCRFVIVGFTDERKVSTLYRIITQTDIFTSAHAQRIHGKVVQIKRTPFRTLQLPADGNAIGMLVAFVFLRGTPRKKNYNTQ